MYDTATHVKMVKKRIRQMRRRRETRRITALYAACTLLSAALVGAADTFAGPKQAALSGMYGSMLLHEGAGGYVLVGVLTFSAAVVLTVVCIRFRGKDRRRNEEQAEKGGDER